MVQDDVTAASQYVEGEVRRLLGGSCEAWEMVMTVRAPPASFLCHCATPFLPNSPLYCALQESNMTQLEQQQCTHACHAWLDW